MRRGAGSGHNPAWCVVDHDDGTSAEHQSEGVSIPVLSHVPIRGGPSEPSAREVVAVRHGGTDGTWLYVGDGEDQYLDLSAASWQRVISTVVEVLDLEP